MMNTMLKLFFGLLLTGLLLPARATVVLPVALEGMAADAALIFHGRVSAVETRLDEVSQRVATYTTFDIIDAIKGSPGTRYTVKQIGGRLPGARYELRIPGVPRFTEGEEYIVFLPPASRLGFQSPIGLSQGKFHIDRQQGVATVRAPRQATAGATQTPRLQRALAGAERADGTTTLDSFKTRIRSLVTP